MSNTRVIRKYPNRRLYDTAESRYITLADVRALVLGNVQFEVIDKKSGDDITRTILLQVISDREVNGDAIMSTAFLEHVIRLYDADTPDHLAAQLERSIVALAADVERRPCSNGADSGDDDDAQPRYGVATASPDELAAVRAAARRSGS